MNNPASLRSEVTRLDWINCPVCRGIADQFAVERVSSLSGIRIVVKHMTHPILSDKHQPWIYSECQIKPVLIRIRVLGSKYANPCLER